MVGHTNLSSGTAKKSNRAVKEAHASAQVLYDDADEFEARATNGHRTNDHTARYSTHNLEDSTPGEVDLSASDEVDVYLSNESKKVLEVDGIGAVGSDESLENPNYLREFPFEDLSPKMPTDTMIDGRCEITQYTYIYICNG